MQETTWIHDITLLDTNTSVVVFISLLGLYALGSQFRISNEPFLQTHFYSPNIEEFKNGVKNENVRWNCDIMNVGTGSAKILEVKYSLSFNNDILDNKFHYSYQQVVEELAVRGLELAQHYDLPRIMDGVIFPPSEKKLLLLFGAEFAKEVNSLDVRFIYLSPIKNKYYKDIPSLPRRKDTWMKIREG